MPKWRNWQTHTTQNRAGNHAGSSPASGTKTLSDKKHKGGKYGKNLKQNVDLGIRETYADISATILDIFGLEKLENGISFKNEIM